MKTQFPPVILAALIMFTGVAPLQAQLVADGGTQAINGITTNLVGSLIVGNSGSFTTLIITNAGTVTNTTTGVIGQLFTARTNRVIVTGTNSVWSNGATLAIGSAGSFNELVLTNGGRVVDTFGNICFNPGSSNNTVVVTGTNSHWLNSGSVNVGNSGPSGQLVITNGGKTSSFSGRIGNASTSSNNLAIVTGAGSLWTPSANFGVGGDGSFNQLLLTAGGQLTTTDGYMGGNIATNGIGSRNAAVISGAGSKFTVNGGGNFHMGMLGSFNQLIVTNGGAMQVALAVHIGTAAASSNNTVVVAGTNSLLSSFGGAPTDIYVGSGGINNQLTVSNAGTVVAYSLVLGAASSSSNNFVLIEGGHRNCHQFLPRQPH